MEDFDLYPCPFPHATSRMENIQDLIQGDKREGIVFSQGKFILIWTRVMAMGCREKGDQEIFRKYNQMYLEIGCI